MRCQSSARERWMDACCGRWQRPSCRWQIASACELAQWLLSVDNGIVLQWEPHAGDEFCSCSLFRVLYRRCREGQPVLECWQWAGAVAALLSMLSGEHPLCSGAEFLVHALLRARRDGVSLHRSAPLPPSCAEGAAGGIHQGSSNIDTKKTRSLWGSQNACSCAVGSRSPFTLAGLLTARAFISGGAGATTVAGCDWPGGQYRSGERGHHHRLLLLARRPTCRRSACCRPWARPSLPRRQAVLYASLSEPSLPVAGGLCDPNGTTLLSRAARLVRPYT